MTALEHPHSYYAATANWETDYPPLDGDARADVCVIGGGFTGLNAAIEVVERGYSVVLLEANRIGWGASGRNGGQLIGGFADLSKIEKRLGKDAVDVVWDMGLECTEIVRDRIEHHNIECDLKTGYFDAALNRKQLRGLLGSMFDKEQRGYPHRLTPVKQENIRSVVGTDIYVGGVINNGWGHLHPLNLCLGEAKAAAELGVQIHEQTTVKRIRRRAAPEVHTDHGIVHASYVVLAGNAYLGDLVPALSGRSFPAGSFIIATEPLSEDLAHDILPQDMAVCDQNAILDYYRLSADRRLLFGGRCNYTGREPKSISATLGPRMRKVFPQLEDVAIDYEWGGNLAISINRLPLLGCLEGVIYYAMGYSGHGVAPTHVAARVLAEAISGQTQRLDLFQKIRHLKLPGGKWFASPAVAAGMLYYRLKDILAI